MLQIFTDATFRLDPAADATRLAPFSLSELPRGR